MKYIPYVRLTMMCYQKPKQIITITIIVMFIHIEYIPYVRVAMTRYQ
jgi:hypothetical protein